MREKTQQALKLQFDRWLRPRFYGARITSDAGPLACRKPDGTPGLTEAALTYLRETRGSCNVQYELVLLLRQWVYSGVAGYADMSDVVRLARDLARQAVVGR